jgi:hypothetical protein
MSLELPIHHRWDRLPLPPTDRAVIQLARDGDDLLVRVFAPFHGDPAPQGPPGPTPGLWNHEVVELFIAGPADHYVEIELGPHGHHLVLVLDGVRKPVEQGLPMHLTTRRCGTDWWSAEARVPISLLPPGPHRANAYRIHGPAEARAYHAHAPVPGAQPDFHQLDRFVPIELPGPTGTVAEDAARAILALFDAPASLVRKLPSDLPADWCHAVSVLHHAAVDATKGANSASME